MQQDTERPRHEPVTAQRRIIDSDSHKLVELLSLVSQPEELLPMIALETANRLDCDAVGILALGSRQAAMLEGFELSPALRRWRGEAQAVDDTLAHRLLWASKGEFRDAHLFPVTYGGTDLGALAVLSRQETELDHEARRFAEGLARITGVSLELARTQRGLVRAREQARLARTTLERGEPLRMLGEMTLGVSHDLKNILNPLSLHLHLCSTILGDGEPEAKESIAEMTRVVRRGIGLLARLKTFGRGPGEDELEVIEDPAALVAEAIRIAKPRTHVGRGPQPIEIEGDLAPTPPIRANPAELVSAVVNLVLNAMDAMPEGGTIQVSTGRSEHSVVIRVADDGPGISTELQEKVFEPFFTTKKRTGTGLGLAMVKAFMERCGGRVSLRSTPAVGSAFSLRFPLAVPTDPVSDRSP